MKLQQHTHKKASVPKYFKIKLKTKYQYYFKYADILTNFVLGAIVSWNIQIMESFKLSLAFHRLTVSQITV